MMRARILEIALLSAAIAVPTAATAKPKRAKPACGLGYMPFTEGATWVYEYEPSGKETEKRGPKVDPPPTVTIKVVTVKTKGKSATITLEESFRKVKLTTELSCNSEGFRVDPQSFLWNGEPGGGLGQTLGNVKREGVSLPGKKGLKGSFTEEMTATLTRSPAREDLGKPMKVELEIEREATVAGAEGVVVGDAEITATRVDVKLRGRARVEGRKNASTEMRSNTAALLWFAKGKGLVRVTNPKSLTYVLKPAPAATK